jgi:hypothetical protein
MHVLTKYIRKLITWHRVPVRNTEKLYSGVLQCWEDCYDEITD